MHEGVCKKRLHSVDKYKYIQKKEKNGDPPGRSPQSGKYIRFGNGVSTALNVFPAER